MPFNENFVRHIALKPGHRILIPSGIKGLLEPPASMLMAANKSGIATKKGLIFTAEIVDSPYVGEIHIGIYNTSQEIQVIEAGQNWYNLFMYQFILPSQRRFSKRSFILNHKCGEAEEIKDLVHLKT